MRKISPVRISLLFFSLLFPFFFMSGLARGEEVKESAARNPFGMQLRSLPVEHAAVCAPVIIREAPSNESSMLARKDGALEIYYITKPESTSVSMIRSVDSGFSWSDPVELFPLPGKAYYAVQALEDDENRVQVVFHIAGEGPGGYRNRLYEVYHTRQSADGLSWSKPQLVIPGYVGSIRGFMQMTNGRILLGVGKAAPDRASAPASGPDYGWHDTVIFFSDDRGETWTQSPDILKFPLDMKFITRYGAIEPDMVELADGRIWMLIRDRGGRFMQSFSPDGKHWSKPEKSSFITSDSPATLLKLKDGRIILLFNACQNWSNPKSYARGGRDVLQAAISADNGTSWRGFREILNQTAALESARGDKGSAYASAAETRDGKIALCGGQGEGNRFIVLFDPNWLLDDAQHDDLTEGPVYWTQYGKEGIHVEAPVSVGEKAAVALPLGAQEPSGAEWNFPAMSAGKIKMELWIPADVSLVSLSLTDHFSRADDSAAGEHAVYHFSFQERPEVVHDQWVEIELKWDAASGCIRMGENLSNIVPAGRVVEHGLSYLRVEGLSPAEGSGALKVRNLSVERSCPLFRE